LFLVLLALYAKNRRRQERPPRITGIIPEKKGRSKPSRPPEGPGAISAPGCRNPRAWAEASTPSEGGRGLPGKAAGLRQHIFRQPPLPAYLILPRSTHGLHRPFERHRPLGTSPTATCELQQGTLHSQSGAPPRPHQPWVRRLPLRILDGI